MSKIDVLIQQFSPKGVEYKHLWEITAWDKKFNAVDNYKQDKVIKYNYLLAADLKNLKAEYGNIKLLTTSNSDLWTTEELAGSRICEGEVVAIPWGGTASVQYYKGKFLTADNRLATSLDINVLDNKYLYYAMLNKTDILQSFYRGSGIKHPNMAKVLDLRIPVPPLQVQHAITSLLDSYSELEEALEVNLKSELDARKKQYEYYRDEFLSFDGDEKVEWKPLGSVGEFIRGKRFTKADYDENGIDAIHYGEIYTYYGTFADSVMSHVREELRPKLRFAKPGDVILTDVGETVEDVGKAVAWLGSKEVAIHDHSYAFRHTMNPKFVSYYMQTSKFRNDKAKYVARTKVKTLMMNGLAKVSIPVPSMAEQNRIVTLLDNFDTVVDNVSETLPAEISARRRQYEYFRGKLLAFPELVA
jgi:type I restriction enzyme S subunit